ncbi:threonine/serine ThrE exporter family protein [Gordonia zhaorongruii]|uniref:threonine/serine ThrE exporter family protein n=1 Tax=Gordonia zhaorongruii TaxID=2597659 RepID=UPI00105291AE|nr:threonine/serine exporter family protein [Gordonia zhaorongruii]
MRAFLRRGLDRVLGTAQATIDTIEPGSIVVAPRKPIALDDEAAITEVLDLAAKIGAVLLDSGTGAIDTRRQIEFVAGIYGLENLAIDVTYNSIVVCALRGHTLPPVTALRTVEYRSIDFTRLAHVDRLVRRIRQLAITPATAHSIVDEIITNPHPYRYWIANAGWGLMASGISILLGGTFIVGLTAFVMTVMIVTINRRMARAGIPMFFQQLLGGFIAVLPAAAIFHWREAIGIDFIPAQLIAAGIVVLLSGLSLVGSVQDAITGAPITGTARFAEVVLLTGGILAGVGLAVRLVEAFGIILPGLGTEMPFGPADLPARIIGGAIAAGSFAIGSYAEKRAIPVAFGAGIVSSAVAFGLELTDAGGIVTAAVAAVVVGLVGGLAARRALTPPLVVAVAGITPLLPGLAIYRGLYGLMSDQTLDGFGQVAAAVTTGCALAAGVTLGEFIARTLRRPQLPNPLVHIPRQNLMAHRNHRNA